ncbi:hypothetical protein G1H11_17540 [Phytoactinopolyspora alkaliphila]|uniref:Uncharacterized protein n=1 Tax=Phytoactinopolyspora alkaliphila TaxID=1783498 RepID=A0A6N9YPX9_9ACTN|nr:hypothetical protein [Phytoactinopolyspora alkaliphila]
MAAALRVTDQTEMLPVTTIVPAELVPTYEVRLRRSEAGEGPETVGLSQFVHCLRLDNATEMFNITNADTTWIGLLDANGVFIALTCVMRNSTGVHP